MMVSLISIKIILQISYMRLLEVHKTVKTRGGRVFYVNCVFNLATIIKYGYAPDDIISQTIGKCIAAYLAMEPKHVN